MRYKLPEKPKVRSIDVLKYFQDNKDTVIYNKDIVREYRILKTHASNILANLRAWKLIKYHDKKKKGHGGYILTDYGKKFKIQKEE
jgi:transcription initiation factor IIE alpha subunit